MPASVDQELSIRFRSWDEDNDGLIAALGYRVTGSADDVTIFVGLDDLPGGTVDAVLDTGALPSMQRIDIIVILDDGFSDDPSQNKT